MVILRSFAILPYFHPLAHPPRPPRPSDPHTFWRSGNPKRLEAFYPSFPRLKGYERERESESERERESERARERESERARERERARAQERERERERERDLRRDGGQKRVCGSLHLQKKDREKKMSQVRHAMSLMKNKIERVIV